MTRFLMVAAAWIDVEDDEAAIAQVRDLLLGKAGAIPAEGSAVTFTEQQIQRQPGVCADLRRFQLDEAAGVGERLA